MPRFRLGQMMVAIAAVALSLAALVWFGDRPKIITDSLIAAAYVVLAIRCLSSLARARAHPTSTAHEATGKLAALASSSRRNK